MSTVYESVEEAKRAAARFGGIDYDSAVFKEVPELTVGGPLDHILPAEEAKKRIVELKKAQKAFKFLNKNGEEVKIVISPFRHGFELWLVGNNGFSVRT